MMSSTRAFFKGLMNVCACINVCILDRWKDKTLWCIPDGPGQLVGRGTEQRPHESWGPGPGACSFPPPLSLSSPPYCDQYWVLITEDSVVVLSSSHLLSYFLFSGFYNLCLHHAAAIYSNWVCVDVCAPSHILATHFVQAFLDRFLKGSPFESL